MFMLGLWEGAVFPTASLHLSVIKGVALGIIIILTEYLCIG